MGAWVINLKLGWDYTVAVLFYGLLSGGTYWGHFIYLYRPGDGKLYPNWFALYASYDTTYIAVNGIQGQYIRIYMHSEAHRLE